MLPMSNAGATRRGDGVAEIVLFLMAEETAQNFARTRTREGGGNPTVRFKL